MPNAMPMVDPASDEEAQKKKYKATLPRLGLGLGGVSLASLGAAYGLGSDAQADRVRSAVNSYDPKHFQTGVFPPNQTGLTYYQNTLSPGAQLTPFGVPAGEVMVRARQDPDLMEAVGAPTYALSPGAQAKGLNGLAHYRAFANGPVSAYIHQLKAKLPNTPVPEALAGRPGVNTSDYLGRKLEDFIERQTGERINPFEFTTDYMPHEQQKDLMEKFHLSLTPEEQKFRLEVENPGPGYNNQVQNYLPRIQMFNKVRDALKSTGVTLGGAAAGAAGGHFLYDIIQDGRDKEKTTLGRSLSSVGGAGLGGLAAYLAATPGGHSVLRNLKRMAMGLPAIKAAAEVEIADRKSKPVHSFVDRLVFDPAELRPPSRDADQATWQTIADRMRVARPYQLSTAKVLSGRHDPSQIINQVERHKHHDSVFEDIAGVRDQLAQAYSTVSPAWFEQIPASYHPYANTAIVNENSPGALIHELGHGVDMAPREGESNWWREMRWNYKPTLWQEFDAWRKGRKAFQEGSAADIDPNDQKAVDQYKEIMKSYNARKYPAYGTYLGAATGAVGGALAGGALGVPLAMSANIPTPITVGAILGAGLGGTAGLLGGGALGRWWAARNADRHADRAVKQLEAFKSNPERLAALKKQLLEIRKSRQLQSQKSQAKKKRAA